MALVATPAVVLSTLRYGETSKIVRLATREHGVQSAIAKGADRPRSRFGASLQPFSVGIAHIIVKESRELQLLTAFDVGHVRIALAADLDRFAAASVLAEVMLRFAPSEPCRRGRGWAWRRCARRWPTWRGPRRAATPPTRSGCRWTASSRCPAREPS